VQERLGRRESKCRARSVEENLHVWEEMKKGMPVGQNNALRFNFIMKVGGIGCVVGALHKIWLVTDCACQWAWEEMRKGTLVTCRPEQRAALQHGGGWGGLSLLCGQAQLQT
jgi:hypothetical protein